MVAAEKKRRQNQSAPLPPNAGKVRRRGLLLTFLTKVALAVALPLLFPLWLAKHLRASRPGRTDQQRDESFGSLQRRLDALAAQGRTVTYMLHSCIAQLDVLLGARHPTRPNEPPSALPGAGRALIQKKRMPGRGPVTARRVLTPLLVLTLIVPAILIAVVFAISSVYESYVGDFSTPSELAINESSSGSQIYDRNGKLLYEFLDDRDGIRLPVGLAEMSVNMVAATIATEDASFYANPGINTRGLIRAAWENLSPITTAEILEGSGGSSITQQLIKNVYIPPEQRQERSFERKIKEIAYALELTQDYSKDQILEWYLNQISYGGLYYGVEAASQGYFGKSANQLTLAEAALLAGIPQSPAKYDPRNQPEAAIARRNEILDLMAGHSEISLGGDLAYSVIQWRIEAAKAAPLEVIEQVFPISAPHFVFNHVTPQLEAMFGREALLSDGLIITTSLDMELQNKALEQLEHWISEFEDISNSRNGALIVLDAPTGEILVLIGSRDYYREDIDGNVDNLTALNSPGSSFKPFIYLASFIELGWTPSTTILDTPISFRESDGTLFEPRNPNPISYLGRIDIRTALGNSLNVPAFKTALQLGVGPIVEVAKRAGFTTLDGQYGPAIAIGGVDLTTLDLAMGYGVLANNGSLVGQTAILPVEEDERQIEPISILRVEDASGRVLYDADERQTAQQVIPAQQAYMVTSILSDAKAHCITFGCGGVSIPGRTAGVKTGTSEPFDPDGPDAGKIGKTWAFGYTPDYVVGVWAGNSDNAPIINIFSTSISFRAMRDTLQALYDGHSSEAFAKPPGIDGGALCSDGPDCGTELEATASSEDPESPEKESEETSNASRPPIALLTSPTGTVSGTVRLTGWAWSDSIESYTLQVGFGAAPSSWRNLGTWRTPVEGGVLGSWSTAGFVPGQYTIRVVVHDAVAGTIVSPGITLTLGP